LQKEMKKRIPLLNQIRVQPPPRKKIHQKIKQQQVNSNR
jgi:hypothetical protein